MDDDAMILSSLADGSTAWVSSASTRSARSVVKDEDIPFEEFCQDDGSLLEKLAGAQVLVILRPASTKDSSSVSPYDLSVVNEVVMQETRTRVYWEDRNKKDNARNFKVSIR
ncbi:hypothetical protein F4604DRAFT_1923524 [Suillus subluteus]|nr:hypothetical protein F4604DRAFT_1923524 [Suillus subluteus]